MNSRGKIAQAGPAPRQEREPFGAEGALDVDLDRSAVGDQPPVAGREPGRVDDLMGGDPVDDQLTDLLLGVADDRSGGDSREPATAGLTVVVDRHDELCPCVDRSAGVGQVDV